MLLGGLLDDTSWRMVYLALAAITLVGVIPLSLLQRRRVPEEIDLPASTARIPPRAISFSPTQLQWLPALAGGRLLRRDVDAIAPYLFILRRSRLGPAVGAEMLSLMLLGGVALRLVSSLIADRLGGVKTQPIGSALQCVALFLYLPFDAMVSLYFVSLIVGLAQDGIVPSYALIVRENLPAREAGARVGLVMLATIVGMALGGWMSGWIYDMTGSYQMAFLNGIGWNFQNIGIMVLDLMKGRRHRAAAA